MRAVRRFLRRLWLSAPGRGDEARLREEMRAHLDRQTDENRRAGMTPTEARRQAVLVFGPVEAIKDQYRDEQHLPQLDELVQDVRYGLRTLLRQPVFAASAILMLAFGIGATTAIFSVVNAVLIRPLPYPDSDALVRIVHSIGGNSQPYFPDAIYLAYVGHNQAFDDVGVWSPGETATVTGQGDPEEVPALRASHGVLSTLGVAPHIGRRFSLSDDRPETPDTAILSHEYWQRRFAADRGVLGRSVTINGRPHEIVGVMPSTFGFGGEFEVILPLRVDPAAPIPSFRLLGVARLKPGVSLSQANADVLRVLQAWFETAKVRPAVRARWAPALQSLKQDVVGDISRALWVLMGAISVVLLMACANVANMLLIRTEGRQQELAIRGALGASTIRIARQLLVESLALALVGGIFGMGLAYVGLRLLVALGPTNLPRLSEISIDPTVLVFSVAVSLVAGALFGVIPTLKQAHPRLVEAIFYGGRGASLTRARQRSQHALVCIQIALAVVLLVSAGLMIRSFSALREVEPGFTQSENVQTFTISLPETMIPELERVTRMQQEVLDRVSGIPGVVSAAFATRMPMGRDRSSAALLVQGRSDDDRTPPNRQVKVISPDLFRTQGTPMIAGRDFTWMDIYDKRGVAIVSENLAREFWGSPPSALGQQIRDFYDKTAPWREVVGVVGDVHDDGAHQPAPATVYWPAEPDQTLQSMSGYQARRVSVAIRTERAGTDGFLKELRRAVWSVSPTLPLSHMRTLDEVYRESLAPTSFTLILLTIAGAMALGLGISGIYGVISYDVSQRRREIGIRLALGAQPTDIRRLFLRRSLIVGGIALAIGIGVALSVARLMDSLIFGISPLDPIAFAAALLVLTGAALLSSYLPTRRAVALDPVETLRLQ